jgi:hypothetical protein
MLDNLPSDLIRRVFWFSRSPTAWLMHAEFARRAQVAAQEEADEEAWGDAAERHYANEEAENERRAYEEWLNDTDDDDDA